MNIELYFNNKKEVISKLPATFKEFRKYVSTAFSIPPSSRWKIEYIDSDDDKITMCIADEYGPMYKEFETLESNNYAEPVKLYVVFDENGQSDIDIEHQNQQEVEEYKEEKAEQFGCDRRKVDDLISQGKFLEANEIRFVEADEIMKEQFPIAESEVYVRGNGNKEEQKLVADKVVPEVPVDSQVRDVVVVSEIQESDVYVLKNNNEAVPEVPADNRTNVAPVRDQEAEGPGIFKRVAGFLGFGK